MSTPNGENPSENHFCPNCGRINNTLNPTICPHCQSDSLESTNFSQFENLNLQTLTNIFFPILISEIQSNSRQQRRHHRATRRIKRVTHQYLPPSFQTIHTPIRFFQINQLLSRQIFENSLIIFDQNNDFDRLPRNRDDLQRLPTFTLTPSTLLLQSSCSICLENFDLTSDVKQLPICHHIFHSNCLIEWLICHDNCPLCRTRIPSIEQRTISFQPLSIKTTNPPSIPSNSIESTQSLTDTPQLPRFDSSFNLD